MEHIFKALRSDKVAYKWTSERDFHPERSDIIHTHAKEFQTFGDNLTQHSPDYHVISEFFIDYLASLYLYLKENPKAVESVANAWPEVYRLTTQQCKFIAALKYKEGKAQWYNFSELKQSSSPSKLHDRRWEAVQPYQDGSLEGMFATALKHVYCTGAIERFWVYLTLREYLIAEYNYYQTIAGHGFNSDDQYIDVEYAYRAVNELIVSYRASYQAERVFACLKTNYLDKQTKGE